MRSETFYQYFTEIDTNLAEKLPNSTKTHSDFIGHIASSFQLEPVTLPKLLKLQKDISADKATRLSKIRCHLVKLAAPLIAKSLCSIFNTSILHGIFSSDWKVTKIIPLHKGNEKDEINNYRPISILSSTFKILERLIHDQLYEYLTKNNLLSECQSGFRSFHSTNTSLLDATNEWLANMDQGKLNSAIFLDLSKSLVNHAILHDTLTKYGLNEEAVRWFKSYLSDRRQQCLVNGHLSSSRLIKCGVPQGSILEPLLFIINNKDLPDCLKYSKPRMYADDTNITTTGKSITETIQAANSDLENITEWLYANKLSLNTGKTEQMFFASDDMLNKIGDFTINTLSGEIANPLELLLTRDFLDRFT